MDKSVCFELKNWLVLAPVLVLFYCIIDRLTRQWVLELNRSNRDAVQAESDIRQSFPSVVRSVTI